MSPPVISTLNAPSYENALERLRLARVLFAEQMQFCRDFHSQTEKRRSLSSEGLPAVPSLLFPESSGQAT